MAMRSPAVTAIAAVAAIAAAAAAAATAAASSKEEEKESDKETEAQEEQEEKGNTEEEKEESTRSGQVMEERHGEAGLPATSASTSATANADAQVQAPAKTGEGSARYLSLTSDLTWARKYAKEEIYREGVSTFKAHCPCCWRPLNLELWHDGWKIPPRPSNLPPIKPPGGKRAYCLAIWGENLDYAVGAVTLAQSIRASGSTYDLVLLHTPDLPEWPHRTMLRQFFKLEQVKHVDSVQELFSGDKETSRFKYVFTKLHIMALTDYDKILFLDTDTLVLRNMDDLFDLPAPAAMRRGMNVGTNIVHGQKIDGRAFFANDTDPDWAFGQGTGINAGVMLVEPDWRVHSRMLFEVKTAQHPAHVRGNGPEQDYLSRFWADAPWTHIGVEYNFQVHQMYNALSPHCAHVAERTALLNGEEGFRKVRLVHFSGELKPWHRHFGSGPKPDQEGFVQTMLASFVGHWLWVKKDRSTWARMSNKTEEGIEMAEDGTLFRVVEGENGQTERVPVEEQTELHAKAEEFIRFTQARWDEAWEAAQEQLPEELRKHLAVYDRETERCALCKSYLTRSIERWPEKGRNYCVQCWWKYEPVNGSQVSIVAWKTGVSLDIDGYETQVSMPPKLRDWASHFRSQSQSQPQSQGQSRSQFGSQSQFQFGSGAQVQEEQWEKQEARSNSSNGGNGGIGGIGGNDGNRNKSSTAAGGTDLPTSSSEATTTAAATTATSAAPSSSSSPSPSTIHSSAPTPSWPSNAWFFFLPIEEPEKECIWVSEQLGNCSTGFAAIQERLSKLFNGSAILIATWGSFPADSEAWRILKTCGGPGEPQERARHAFAMVGVKGQMSGQAKQAHHVAYAVATKKIYTRLNLTTYRIPSSP